MSARHDNTDLQEEHDVTTETEQHPGAERAGIYLTALVPAELLMDRNTRDKAEKTVKAGFVADLRAYAANEAHQLDGRPYGNHTPITVVRVPADGIGDHPAPDGEPQFRVWLGHRRTLGCQRAGCYVLAIVAGDDGDDNDTMAARIVDQLTENDDREQLPVRDRAAAMATLFDDYGLSVPAIAKRTGFAKATVSAGIDVAHSELAMGAADRWRWLTLEQDAVFAEFTGDTDALKELAQVAKDRPGQFDHTAARLRASAADRAQHDALLDQLAAAGYEVADRGRPDWTQNLDNLRTPEGEKLTPERHASCPGRAVIIGQDWWRSDEAAAACRERLGLADGDEEPEPRTETDAREAGFEMRWQVVHHLCGDPDRNGHVNELRSQPGKRTPADSSRTQDQAEADAAAAEAKRAERATTVKNNRDWRTATGVRRDAVKGLLSRPSLKPKALADAATAFVTESMAHQMQSSAYNGHSVAATLLGLDLDGSSAYNAREAILAELARTRTTARLLVIQLAMALGVHEQEAENVECWRSAQNPHYDYGYGAGGGHRTPAVPRYLRWLETHLDGYELSPVEDKVAHYDRKAKPARKRAPAGGSGQGTAPGGGTGGRKRRPARWDDPDGVWLVQLEDGHIWRTSTSLEPGDVVQCHHDDHDGDGQAAAPDRAVVFVAEVTSDEAAQLDPSLVVVRVSPDLADVAPGAALVDRGAGLPGPDEPADQDERLADDEEDAGQAEHACPDEDDDEAGA